MNTMQTDIGRQTKVVVIAAAAAVIAAAYVAYTYAVHSSTKPSTVTQIRPGQPTPVVESDYYRDVLARYNKQNAADANQKGETYVSVFSARPMASLPSPEQSPNQTTVQAAALPFNQPSPPPPSPQVPVPTPATAAPQREQLNQQAEALMANWAGVGHSAARVSESDYLPSAATAAPQPVAPVIVGKGDAIVPALLVLPAMLGTDIDTDENSIVEAAIPAGRYAGATVIAMGYKLAGNGVDMTFTLMNWRGRSYRIHAKPVDQSSMRSTLSGEVNNRYLSRILWPAIASGLGRTGYLFEQADTQTVITPLGGAVQTHPGTPSSRAIAGTIVGGAAAEAGQVMRHDAAQRPVRQVLIPRDLTMGVRFIEPVFVSDEIVEQLGPLGSPPQQSPMPTVQPIFAPTSSTSSPQ